MLVLQAMSRRVDTPASRAVLIANMYPRVEHGGEGAQGVPRQSRPTGREIGPDENEHASDRAHHPDEKGARYTRPKKEPVGKGDKDRGEVREQRRVGDRCIGNQPVPHGQIRREKEPSRDDWAERRGDGGAGPRAAPISRAPAPQRPRARRRSPPDPFPTDVRGWAHRQYRRHRRTGTGRHAFRRSMVRRCARDRDLPPVAIRRRRVNAAQGQHGHPQCPQAVLADAGFLGRNTSGPRRRRFNV